MSTSTYKRKFFKAHAQVKETCSQIWYTLNNKYYNLWMTKFKVEGASDEENNYIFRKFYDEGKISAFEIKNVGLGYASFAAKTFGMYDNVSTLNFVNTRGVSDKVIPSREMVVGKDCTIGYAMPSQKSVKSMIDYYIGRMVEAELILDTNLNQQKVPYIVTADSTASKEKAEDVVEKIINNDVIIYVNERELQNIKVAALNAPYLLDKLKAYERTIEQELLTMLGIDNNADASLMQTHVSIDAVNANNETINYHHKVYKNEIEAWIDRTNTLFGTGLKLIDYGEVVRSVHEEQTETEKEGEGENV